MILIDKPHSGEWPIIITLAVFVIFILVLSRKKPNDDIGI